MSSCLCLHQVVLGRTLSSLLLIALVDETRVGPAHLCKPEISGLRACSL